MNQRTVLHSHKASYSDPIRVAKGDIVRLTGREDLWDRHRWLWAVAEDGKEGWVPDTLIAKACRDHSDSRHRFSSLLSRVFFPETGSHFRETRFRANDRTTASRDYSAVELTCAAGDILDVAWETHGWAWCRKSDGTEGWVPLANLSE